MLLLGGPAPHTLAHPCRLLAAAWWQRAALRHAHSTPSLLLLLLLLLLLWRQLQLRLYEAQEGRCCEPVLLLHIFRRVFVLLGCVWLLLRAGCLGRSRSCAIVCALEIRDTCC